MLLNGPVLKKELPRRLTGKHTLPSTHFGCCPPCTRILHSPLQGTSMRQSKLSQMRCKMLLSLPTSPRSPGRDIHLWSPEIAAFVGEKGRLRRIWFFSRNPRVISGGLQRRRRRCAKRAALGAALKPKELKSLQITSRLHSYHLTDALAKSVLQLQGS